MFYIQKFVESLLLPSNLIGFLAVLGIVALILQRPRFGQGAFILSAFLLIIGGWAPLGPAALMVLENRFPQPQLVEPVTGIIMLGGSVNTHITAVRGQTALNEAGERVTTMAELGRKFPQARVLISSGANVGHALQAQPITEAEIVRGMLVDLGVEASRIEIEGQSRDTRENAEKSIALANPQPGQTWVLVTSASHMPRAVASFRAVGFPVVPYPVDYRTQGPANLRQLTGSIAEGLQALDLAAHEWLGLMMYRLAGRTQELLPSP